MDVERLLLVQLASKRSVANSLFVSSHSRSWLLTLWYRGLRIAAMPRAPSFQGFRFRSTQRANCRKNPAAFARDFFVGCACNALFVFGGAADGRNEVGGSRQGGRTTRPPRSSFSLCELREGVRRGLVAHRKDMPSRTRTRHRAQDRDSHRRTAPGTPPRRVRSSLQPVMRRAETQSRHYRAGGDS